MGGDRDTVTDTEIEVILRWWHEFFDVDEVCTFPGLPMLKNRNINLTDHQILLSIHYTLICNINLITYHSELKRAGIIYQGIVNVVLKLC